MNPLRIKYKEFPTTVGIEYTRVPEEIDIDSFPGEKIFRSECYKIGSKLEASDVSLREKYLFYPRNDFKCEDGALEYASSVMKDMNSVIEFQGFMNNIFSGSDHRWVANTHTEDKYIEGGGEHIHLGGMTHTHFVRMFSYIMANPELVWFMADFCDNDVLPSRCISALAEEGDVFTSIRAKSLAALIAVGSHEWGMTPIQYRLTSKHDRSIQLNTAEIRFFQASESLQHMIDNVDLALAIFQYTHQSSHNCCDEDENCSIYDMMKYAGKHESVHLHCFKECIQELHLDYRRYKKYEKNYRNRRRYGSLI